ncbi:MAG: hypothetical protein Ctma_0692 [Catillopecten margaritatus gill symbiont]|uniref:Uncharacterized protein n=1 Tax=Catillopecten margaritatus gill symbiont TaxID=3083288 RepID=A0AAU6PG34_9GAMM
MIWIYREYKIIKQLDGNDNKYNGEQKWWTPNHNSTFIKVNDYCYFENLILTPFLIKLYKILVLIKYV